MTASVFTGAVMAVLAACGHQADPAAHTPARSLPVITDESQYTYPLDDYLPTETQQKRFQQAFPASVGSCVQRFGLRYTPAGRTIESAYLWDPGRGYFHIYNDGAGVVSERRAAQFGYHDPHPPAVTVLQDYPEPSPELLTVVNGTSNERIRSQFRDSRGKLLPAHGCYGEVFEKLGGKGPKLPDLDPAWDTSDPNPGTRGYGRALEGWVECMRSRGHRDAKTPQWYGFRFSAGGGRATPRETALALDDVRCKKRTHVADEYVAARTFLEKRLLDANQASFDAYRHWAAQVTSTVDRILVDAAAGRR